MSSDGAARSLKKPSAMPAVSEAHRRQAFAELRLINRSYDEAQGDPVLARLIELRATLLRNREWAAAQGLPTPPPGRTQHNFSMPRTPRIF